MFYQQIVKRIFDLLFAIIILIFLSPFLLIISFTILVLNGRPILFQQDRPGYMGKIFTLLKFRTMRKKTRELEKEQDRLSSLGRFLRKNSLDELPSLINIIKGEMSFIGPRPLLKKYLNLYSQRQSRRHNVKPGLSGLAQIKGRNLVDWDERLNYDVLYVDNQSFFLDLMILIQTLVITLKRTGISPKNNEIMPEFNPKNK